MKHFNLHICNLFLFIFLFGSIIQGCSVPEREKNLSFQGNFGNQIDSVKYYIDQAEYEQANERLSSVFQAINSEDFYFSTDNILKAYLLNAKLNSLVGNFDIALNNYLKALDFIDNNGSKINKSEVLIHIAEFYRSYHDVEQARHYLNLAKLLIEEKPENYYQLAKININNAFLTTNLKKKEEYLKKALNYANDVNSKYIMAMAFEELGVIMDSTGKGNGVDYFLNALDLWREVGDPKREANTLLNIVDHYLGLGDFAVVQTYYDTVGNILGNHDWIETKIAFYSSKFRYYSLIGNPKMALDNKIQWDDLRQIKMENETKRIVTGRRIAAKIEEKNSLIEFYSQELSNQRNTLILFVLLILISIILIGYVFYLNQKLRKTNRKISTQNNTIEGLYSSVQNNIKEKNLLFRELHHRVKNNLAVLTGIFEYQKGIETNPDMITLLNDINSRIAGIATIHQLVYSKDDFRKVQLKHYFEALVMYIGDMQRPQVKIAAEIDCGNDIVLEQSFVHVLGIILNELILESIKIARSQENPLKCYIGFEKIDDKYLFNFKDNREIPINKRYGYDKSELAIFLIKSLTEELNGSLTVNHKQGYIIQFGLLGQGG